MSSLRRGHETTTLGWYEAGEEPDYRFSLANERTFLAWIRTALAVMAAAVAVVQLGSQLRMQWARGTLGALLAVLGLIVSMTAYSRWAGNQRAMRQSQPLPYPLVLLGIGTVVTGMGLVVLVIVAAG